MCSSFVVDRVRQGGRRWLCLWRELDKKGIPWCANMQLAYARMPELGIGTRRRAASGCRVSWNEEQEK